MFQIKDICLLSLLFSEIIIFLSSFSGVRRECKICGKVLSDLWKHMRTVHGQYRRKVKIPKDEVFGSPAPSTLPTVSETTSISDKTFEQMNSEKNNVIQKQSEILDKFPLPLLPLPPLPVPPTLKMAPSPNAANKSPSPTNSFTKKSLTPPNNKRKSSSPLKVKLPFKMHISDKTQNTKDHDTDEI